MMNELINNPIFQSAVAPLVVALVVGLLLRPLGGRWAGLGFAAGYLVSVYLTVGFQVFPLTSTRKILLLAAGAVMVGAVLDYFRLPRRYVLIGLVVLAASAAIWVIWPLLKRAEGMELWLMLSAAVYVAWVVAWFETLVTKQNHKQQAAGIAAVFIGVGTGVSAVLGASALLGQLGSAIGAAAGALVLLMLFFKQINTGSSFTLPASLLAALIGIAAVNYAGLTWYVLIPLATVPLLVHLPVKEDWNRFVIAIVLTLYSATPAAIAIAITWQIAQSAEPSLY